MIATVVVIVLLVGITTAGFLFYANQPKPRKLIQSTPRVEPPTASSRTEERPAGQPTEQATQSEPVTAATAPKSLDDLKAGAITLEKAKGTGLIYAIGTLRSASEHQRFGVKIELDLLDAKGEKIGVAKDYRSTLEPRQEWRFRALVLDNRAVSARVASLEEDQYLQRRACLPVELYKRSAIHHFHLQRPARRTALNLI